MQRKRTLSSCVCIKILYLRTYVVNLASMHGIEVAMYQEIEYLKFIFSHNTYKICWVFVNQITNSIILDFIQLIRPVRSWPDKFW